MKGHGFTLRDTRLRLQRILMSVTAMTANNEPIPPLDSEEAATDSIPCAKVAKAAYFKWNDLLDLALANTVG